MAVGLTRPLARLTTGLAARLVGGQARAATVRTGGGPGPGYMAVLDAPGAPIPAGDETMRQAAGPGRTRHGRRPRFVQQTPRHAETGANEGGPSGDAAG